MFDGHLELKIIFFEPIVCVIWDYYVNWVGILERIVKGKECLLYMLPVSELFALFQEVELKRFHQETLFLYCAIV